MGLVLNDSLDTSMARVTGAGHSAIYFSGICPETPIRMRLCRPGEHAIYRVQVHGANKVTVQLDHGGRHGAIIAKKYWDRGESCPLAVVHGEDPALFIAGFEYLPDGPLGI